MCIFLDISVFLFLLLPLSVSSLSFDLPSIGNDDANVHIKVEGNASITNLGIQLTPYDRGSELKDLAGRAKYVEPLHLWDKASGDLADFATTFIFNINSDGSPSYADGLTFFLANFSTPFDTYFTRGGGLGLMDEYKPAPDPFVAVVFDTYSNHENRSQTNVSINIKSLLDPVNSTAWLNEIAQGKNNNASITYIASSKILRVVFTGYWNGRYLTDSLSYKVDLREHLPEFVSIGFSAATGAFFEKNTVSSWKFNSTSLKRPGSIISPSPTPSPHREEKKKKKGWKGVVIGLSIGVPILVALLALAIYACLKKTPWGEKGNNHHEIIILGQAMDTEFQMVSSGPKKFSYTELAIATNNFAEEHKLGEGGFGGVYRGLIRDLNLDVAVKRVSSGSKQGINEYAAEVKIISRLRHRNLVPLHGWCHEKGELLLVYEYMPEGCLDSHLFKKTAPPLNWGLRYRIAQGLASALFYLHEEWEKCVLHRDIKSSNVMLDKDFNARLGDFGLAWLVEHENAPEKTICGGTQGYVAPECYFTFKTSKESDVYSFGIVALEIACGKRAILVSKAEGVKSLVEWVWDLYGMGKLLEAADPKLQGEFDEQEMKQLMMIGLWCAHPDSSARPKISHALHCLKFKVELPSLPSKIPKPVYSSTCFNVSSSHWQKLENQMSSGHNSCPSHFTSSSTTDAGSSVSSSHPHTH